MPAKFQVKKIMHWILILALVVVAVIAGGGWYYVNKANQAKNNLADFILANPESTAVVAYTFDENGELVEDGNAIFYSADSPLIMASTMKIIILAAYADAVVRGDFDPEEQVSVVDWEKYYLPMTDGGSHITSLKSVGLESDEHGFALDQTATVSLKDLARVMMHYSENAATDYLIARLGAEKMVTIMQEAGMEHHTPMKLTLGFALAAFNHENPSFSIDPLQRMVEEVFEGNTSGLDRLTTLYLDDTNWRESQIEFMASINSPSLNGEAVWAYQVMSSQLLPKGTAREYAQMMSKVANGNLISPEVSEIMQQLLESVPSDWPVRLLFHDRFGAKDGITAGVVTLASYAVPKRGLRGGQSRVVVILATNLPLGEWAEQVQYQGNYLLSIDFAQAKGEFNKLTIDGNK